MPSTVLILVSLLSANWVCCSQITGSPFEENLMFDDILLTSEQRSSSSLGNGNIRKWPMIEGTVTVPYYFNESIPEGEYREFFRNVSKEFELHTCIKWEETTKDDVRQKVKVFSAQGCYANLGRVARGDNVLCLASYCFLKNVILHEMSHTVGLLHTQSRGDRNSYVKVWPMNIHSGEESNFRIVGGEESFGLPYDYQSLMHYKCGTASRNYSFTISPTNHLAMFKMGFHTGSFRWSDMALINLKNNCTAEFTKKCPGKTCQNKGYVGKDCQCKCPENTRGDQCEAVMGPFFDYVPKCGGNITQEGTVQSLGYGISSTSDPCAFSIIAPKDRKVQITITDVKLGEDVCSKNLLSLQVSNAYYGYSYCNQSSLPVNKVFTSDSNEAAIYYFTRQAEKADIGFRATLAFI